MQAYDYDNSGALATVYDSETGISTTYYYDFTDRMMKYVEEGTGYSHSVGYEYDTINNLTAMVETINGVKHTTGYTYDKGNRVTAITTDGISESYTYDAYGRVSTKVTKNGSATVLTETYTYVTNSAGQPTGQVATHRTRGTGYDVTYSYTYDGNGNILSVSDGTYTTTYAYDSANQLIRENNQQAGKTWTWRYENAGNIQEESVFPYTVGELDTSDYDYAYVYGDSQWGDLLTEHSYRDMTYDSIGNILRNDSDDTLTYKHGRQLASHKEDGNETEDIFYYSYNADGLLVRVANTYRVYEYVYHGTKLAQMTKGLLSGDTVTVSDILHFTYGADGTPATVTHNGTTYYYVTNLQGDVTAILDASGAAVGTYTYDAWGYIPYWSGDTTSMIREINPLRYRGYVFEAESNLYYLQSRFYNPELRRFISPDAFTSTGQGVLGNNMFAYCGNNPVNRLDLKGTQFVPATNRLLAGSGSHITLLEQSDGDEKSNDLLAFMRDGADALSDSTVHINVQYAGEYMHETDRTVSAAMTVGGLIASIISLVVWLHPGVQAASALTTVSTLGGSVTATYGLFDLFASNSSKRLKDGKYQQYKVTIWWAEDSCYLGDASVTYYRYELYYVWYDEDEGSPYWRLRQGHHYETRNPF